LLLFVVAQRLMSQSHRLFDMKMNKQGEAKMGKVMGEYKEGKLKSSSGQKVKSRDQAIAIAMSEAAKKMGRYKGK